MRYLLTLPALLLLGCFEPVSEPEVSQSPTGPHAISGTVRLLGKPPESRTETATCDPRPDAPKMAHRDRTVEVSADGGLAGVFVYVLSATKGSGKDEPPLVLDQKGCAFEPYALGIQSGQPLRIRNSDPTFHNVHWDGRVNPAVNIGFKPSPGAPESVMVLNRSEFLSVRCDVHPWMKCTIGVFDHPFFAVTDAEGRFTISRLPPGRYVLNTWHPLYQSGSQVQVEVPSTQPVNFTYTAP